MEVVLELAAVVVGLLVGPVVVAGGRVHRQVVDQVPVRRIEREVPVVVLVSALSQAVLGAVVDVVAEGDDGPHGVSRRQPLEGSGDGELVVPVVAVDDPHAVVAEGEHGDGDRIVDGRVSPEPAVVLTPRGRQLAAGGVDPPVPPVPSGPLGAVDGDAVAVLAIRREALDPHVVDLVGRGRGDDVATVEHVDDGSPIGRRLGTDRARWTCGRRGGRRRRRGTSAAHSGGERTRPSR